MNENKDTGYDADGARVQAQVQVRVRFEIPRVSHACAGCRGMIGSAAWQSKPEACLELLCVRTFLPPTLSNC